MTSFLTPGAPRGGGGGGFGWGGWGGVVILQKSITFFQYMDKNDKLHVWLTPFIPYVSFGEIDANPAP